MRKLQRVLIALAAALVGLIGIVVAPTTASAAVPGWTTIHRWPGGSLFLACKYSETGGYGPVWRTRLVLAHQPGDSVVHLRAGFTVRRITPSGSWQPIATTNLATDRSGQWDVQLATGSQIGAQYRGVWNADRWSWGIGDEHGGLGDTAATRFSSIRTCG